MRVKATVKAGGIEIANHNAAVARPARLAVRSGVKGGSLTRLYVAGGDQSIDRS